MSQPRYCEDCGTRYSDGMCPNCHEELFILTTRAEDMEAVSEEFAAQADEQRRAIAEAR